MDLNEIAVFIKVVEMGSFTQAAKQLGMPNSTVSAKVSDLETRLGISLIKRTTRKLFVTDEGKAFFERCYRGLEELKAAEEELTAGQKEPQGLLRVTAPIELGVIVVSKIVQAFQSKYPKVKFDLNLSDRTVDLVGEGFDIAIRAGELKDSSLIAKKLGSVYFALFASPQYLKKAGALQSPKDLRNHTCLQFTPMGVEQWKLAGPKGAVSIPMKQQIMSNELNSIKSMALNHIGIALLPYFYCQIDQQQGKLVRVLPEWRSNLNPVHFVYAGHKHTSRKIEAFISVASEIMKETLAIYED